MLLVFLLLPLALSTSLECSSAFLGQAKAPGARPNHGLAAAAGDSDGLAAAGRAAKHKQLVVVVGDRTTRLYHDLWEPGSLTLEHPKDERYLDVCVQRFGKTMIMFHIS